MADDDATADPPTAASSGYNVKQQKAHMQYLKKLSIYFHQAYNTKPEYQAKLADFECETVLGTGAFGVVYLVKENTSGKFYAMKTLEKAKVIKCKQLEHTFYEKKILAALNFPFLVSMRYFFKDNVYVYYVLPFIPGGEMFYHLRNNGKFSESTSKFYAAQVILSLEYLHACDLVYRDLKPENILIDETGYIKMTDFGFCKVLRDRTWTLCGTPEYLAPEIIMSKGYGKSVDWWSLGILMYEMAAGHPPFYASEPMRIYEKVVNGKYKCPQHFTDELKDLLSHTLQIDITKRFGNLKDGTMDFKNHKWFDEINWDMVLNHQTPAPFTPKVKSPGDTTFFESYEAEKIKDSPDCLFGDEFNDF